MAYWLFKSDPETYGFPELQRDQQTVWDGVSNNLALKHLRSARKGDKIFIYHSGAEKAIVGMAEVAKAAYPDPKQNDPKLSVVDIKAGKKLPKPVTLAEIKARKEFANLPLVRMPRLSVMPIDEPHAERILQMASSSKQSSS